MTEVANNSNENKNNILKFDYNDSNNSNNNTSNNNNNNNKNNYYYYNYNIINSTNSK